MFHPKALSFLLLLAIEMPFALAGANPAKMAAEARFDLTSPTVNLEKAEVFTGNGKIERMKWVTGEAKGRSYTANFAVSHYAWTELAVRFTPSSNGVVELKLMGPWEEAAKGVPYKQELLWKEMPLATGTTFSDSARAWSGNVIVGEKAPELTAHYFARTWHNEPGVTTFRVTKDLPVTLRLHAKAALPDDFKEMRRLSQTSRGFLAAKNFRRGVNLANYLEAPPGQDWGMKYSTEDFAHIKDEGFDHVRIPVGWHHYSGAGPDFTLQPEIFRKVDFLVTNALAHGLNVIVNIHHFDAFTTNPEDQTSKFYALWRQIAAHYATSPAGVAFELLN
jgi:hypothetical protein